MEINIQHVEKAYLYLKGLAYHENLNLFLKQQIAEFEIQNMRVNQLLDDEENNNGLDDVFTNIVSTINSNEASANKQFQRWAKDISYRLLPKVVEREEDYKQRKHNEDKGLFISNVRESDEYAVSKINYFITAPVEIHIIETLWCLFVGSVLETKMSKDSYGNRMHPTALKNATSEDGTTGTGLFKRYIYQYNKWRNQAVEVATNISKDNDDV